MTKDIERVLDKLEKIDDKQGEMNETLARLTTTVEIHEKRSTLLEKKVEHVEEHIEAVQGFFKISVKILTVLGILFGIGIGIYKIL